MLNDERDYPEPHEFKPERFLKDGKLDSSVRDPMDIAFGFGRRWALIILSISPCNVITVLVEFAPDNILLIQFSHSLLRPFCQLLTCEGRWMKMVAKLSLRGNIHLEGYGKFHFFNLGFHAFYYKCHLIVNHSTSLAWSSQGLVIL